MTVSNKSKSIAVIGCGPAGLTAALYLVRQGFSVTIYEEFSEPHPVGSGLMLQPTGMSILHELGLLDEILASGRQLGRILGLDAASGNKVLDVHYSKLGGGRFGLGIHRHALFKVLFLAAQKAGVDFEFDKEIVSLDMSATSVCAVTSKGKVLAGHDFVVVANGSGSLIARDMFGQGGQPVLPYGAYWATLNWPDLGFHDDMLEQRYDGASIMAGILPLGCYENTDQKQHKAAFFWSARVSDVDLVEVQGIERWKDRVRAVWPDTSVLLDQISGFGDLTFASYQHYTLKKPYHGNVVFIGDAYHSTSPQLGQGANMALLDAKALDIAIQECRGSFDSVGENFYALRARQIKIFQFLSRVLTPFYQSDSRLLGLIRDHFVAPLVQIPPAPRMMAAMVSGLFVKPFKKSLFFDNYGMELSEPDWHKYSQLNKD